jgi:hypothetical protein
MSTALTSVSDMLVTVKSREIQRGLMAEMQADRDSAARHFLAAAHLELVLAADYDQNNEPELALRSRLSAASCLWRAGECDRARRLIEQLTETHAAEAARIHNVLKDLETQRMAPASR